MLCCEIQNKTKIIGIHLRGLILLELSTCLCLSFCLQFPALFFIRTLVSVFNLDAKMKRRILFCFLISLISPGSVIGGIFDFLTKGKSINKDCLQWIYHNRVKSAVYCNAKYNVIISTNFLKISICKTGSMRISTTLKPQVSKCNLNVDFLQIMKCRRKL